MAAKAKQNSGKLAISHDQGGGCTLIMGSEDLTKKYQTALESETALKTQIDDLKQKLAQCPNVPGQQVTQSQVKTPQTVSTIGNQQGDTNNATIAK